MDIETRDRWVKALRSGEYKQDTEHNCLRVTLDEGEYKYCCLGVLADIQGADLDKYGSRSWFSAENIECRNYTNDQQHKYSGGLDQVTMERCALINDEGMPFTKIADWIEENINAE